MNALQQTYVMKKSAYETMIASSNPNVNELKRLNIELSNLLTQMLTELAKVRQDAGHIEQYRNELVRKLVVIQKDYTTLLNEREQLHTLRGHVQSRKRGIHTSLSSNHCLFQGARRSPNDLSIGQRDVRGSNCVLSGRGEGAPGVFATTQSSRQQS